MHGNLNDMHRIESLEEVLSGNHENYCVDGQARKVEDLHEGQPASKHDNLQHQTWFSTQISLATGGRNRY